MQTDPRIISELVGILEPTLPKFKYNVKLNVVSSKELKGRGIDDDGSRDILNKLLGKKKLIALKKIEPKLLQWLKSNPKNPERFVNQTTDALGDIGLKPEIADTITRVLWTFDDPRPWPKNDEVQIIDISAKPPRSNSQGSTRIRPNNTNRRLKRRKRE
jgi:hypothetical protein